MMRILNRSLMTGACLFALVSIQPVALWAADAAAPQEKAVEAAPAGKAAAGMPCVDPKTGKCLENCPQDCPHSAEHADCPCKHAKEKAKKGS